VPEPLAADEARRMRIVSIGMLMGVLLFLGVALLMRLTLTPQPVPIVSWFAVGFALMAIAPLAGQVIKLSVSRNREFLADAQGALLTRYPPGLISALHKLETAPTAMRSANNATAHLWLNQPSRIPGEKNSTMERLFSTHPPLAERIRRLEEM